MTGVGATRQGLAGSGPAALGRLSASSRPSLAAKKPVFRYGIPEARRLSA